MEGKMKGLLPIGLTVAMAVGTSVLAPPAFAQKCMTAGGVGTGAFEGFASFMAEAAMKNSAKARLGADTVRIGAVAKKCEQKGLLIECHARARACR
jgi:hypothetical protein